MNPESQSQSCYQMKRCKSCRRELPIGGFGQLSTSYDGFNYTCKDCRNYRRRKSFKPDRENEVVFPMAENNWMILNRLEIETNPSINAIDLSTGKRVCIEFAHQPEDCILLTVTSDDLKIHEFIYGIRDPKRGSISEFKQLCLKLLDELNYRLVTEFDLVSGHFPVIGASPNHGSFQDAEKVKLKISEHQE